MNETYPSIYINYHQGVRALTIWHYAPRTGDRLFFSKCHVKNDTKHMLSSIETVAPGRRLVLFSPSVCISDNFASRDNKLFLDDRSSGDRTSALRHFSVRRCRNSTRATKRARRTWQRRWLVGASLRHWRTFRVGVQVGRAQPETAERAREKTERRYSARSVVRVFSNALHGQLAAVVCVDDSRVVICSESDRAMLLEELTGLPAADT